MIRMTPLRMSAAFVLLATVGLVQAEPLLPLADGNRWIFISEDDPSVTMEALVTESRTVDGETWYRYEEFGYGYWLRNVGPEQWQANSEPRDEAPGHMVALADPATAPDWYPYDGLVVDYEACEEPMTVPAGTFDCYVYTFEFGDDLYTRSVFAPGVGMIHTTFEQGSEVRAVVLKDYVLKD
ncbi:hypothetical protein M0534_12565 [Methylonatrum kenyense]|uniref:hypothetical protein n=1 Tax=Methylonatrum kenyense TaxID=455253 RepID=UPI0020BF3554|nr:hypothetical protein [Methylonatrum kenyense]MCK8517154.1 hypothetical protein [Methylonatrum kenyense]